MTAILYDRNENHYGPAPKCVELLREIDAELMLNYTRDFKRGVYSILSERLAEMHGVEETRIILGYGCEDVLKQAVHHYLRPGEYCFTPSASWWYYQKIADEVSGITVNYPLIEKGDAFEFDVDELLSLGRKSHPRVLLISSPNNPTGNIFPTSRLAETLEAFPDTCVILDHAYYGLGDDPTEDLVPLVHKYPNLLILRSFSKLYALAGVRIGYGIAGTGLESFLSFSARYLGYNRISELVALAALDDTDYYNDIRLKHVADREAFYALNGQYEGVKVYRSQANFVLMRFPAHVVEPLNAALRGRGLNIKFLSEPEFVSCARISLGTREENLKLIEALKELLPSVL